MESLQARFVAGLSGRSVDLHYHTAETRTSAVVAAAQRDRLAGLTGNGRANKVAIADNTVGRVELRPAGAGEIDLAGMRGPLSSVVLASRSATQI